MIYLKGDWCSFPSKNMLINITKWLWKLLSSNAESFMKNRLGLEKYKLQWEVSFLIWAISHVATAVVYRTLGLINEKSEISSNRQTLKHFWFFSLFVCFFFFCLFLVFLPIYFSILLFNSVLPPVFMVSIINLFLLIALLGFIWSWEFKQEN